MKCPVCKTECEGITCLNCGFEHLRAEFLNENEVDVWYTDFVFPFMVTEFFKDQVDYPVKMSLAEYNRFQNLKIEHLEQKNYHLKLRDFNYFMRNNLKTIEDMLCFYFRKRCFLCNGRNLDTGRFYRTVVDILLNLGILYRSDVDELSGM